MKNFNAWAIANIEMIFIAPVLLGALVAFAKFVEATGGGSDNTKGVVMILLFIACYFTPTKSLFKNIIYNHFNIRDIKARYIIFSEHTTFLS